MTQRDEYSAGIPIATMTAGADAGELQFPSSSEGGPGLLDVVEREARSVEPITSCYRTPSGAFARPAEKFDGHRQR